jgi:hypothetical protein
VPGSYTVFDMDNRRVGFAPLADCPSPGAQPPVTRTPSGSTSSGLSEGAVAGIVIVVLAVALGLAVWLWMRNRRRRLPSSNSLTDEQLLQGQAAPGAVRAERALCRRADFPPPQSWCCRAGPWVSGTLGERLAARCRPSPPLSRADRLLQRTATGRRLGPEQVGWGRPVAVRAMMCRGAAE